MLEPAKPIPFDLQLFASGGEQATHILSSPVINELSMIFADHKGEKWKPVNGNAVMFSTKGAKTNATPPEGVVTTFDRLVARVGAEKAEAFKGVWVARKTNEGSASDDFSDEDYEQFLSIMFGSLGTPSAYGWDWYFMQGGLVNDLQLAMQIGDIDMRSAAVASGIDTFIAALDDIRSGGDGTKKAAMTEARKAGKRHSKADQDHIDAISGAAKKATDAVKTMSDHVAKLASSQTDDGVGDDDAEKARIAAEKAKAVGTQTAGAPPTGGGLTAEAMLDTLKPLFEAQKATFDKSLADLATTVDAKLETKTAEIAQKATAGAEGVDKLKASLDLIVGAARQPSAPGGDPSMEPDGTTKAAVGTTADEIAAPEIKPDTPVDDAFKAIYANARKARGRKA